MHPTLTLMSSLQKYKATYQMERTKKKQQEAMLAEPELHKQIFLFYEWPVISDNSLYSFI